MKAKRTVVIVLAVVAGAAALLALAPFLIPAGQYRAAIEQNAGSALGRDVKVSGPLRFTVFPTLGLSAQQVSVANAPGGKAPLFASVGELDVGLAVLPLLHGDVQISKLVLKKPTLALEADAGGKPNWAFEPKAPETAPAQGQSAQLRNVGLGDVRIADGALTYRDNTGKVLAISALNARVRLKSLDAPFSLTSDFVLNGDPVKLTLDAPAPRAFVDKKPAVLNFTIESEKLTASLQGAIDPTDFSIAGKLDAKGPSLRKLAAWVGSPIGEGGGMQEFAIIGDLKAQGPATSLSNATIALDNAKGRGDISIITAPGAPPYVKGALTLSGLDVNPYLAAPQTPGAANATQGVNVNQGWGGAHIDLSGLKAIDADLSIATDQLLFQKIRIGHAQVALTLKDGVLNANLKQMDLYGGRGTGSLTLDARGDALKLQNTLAVDGVNAKAFLADAMNLDKIEGAAKFDMTIAGEGVSQQGIMNTLAGKANFTFSNGAIVGVNLAQVARQIQSALTGAAVGAAAKTDFAQMGASFAIAHGVAHTSDFHLLNPFIRVAGEGDINLAQQSMDMKITPKVVTSNQGQGGVANLGGLAVPFRVSGPWGKLHYAPDLGGLVQSKAGELADKLKGGLGGLFGKH